MSFHIAWTIALLVVFVGIVAWAWSGRRKQDFAEAANLPLDDDSVSDDPAGNNSNIERG
jgi:cytochrome c oxidase cbb3-type subunit 4